MTDEEITAGIIRRDERALDALIDKYGGLIKSIVSYHLHENYRGECMNDILLALWKNMKSFAPERNTLKRKYYNESLSRLDERIPSDKTADSGIMREETENEINDLLSALPERDREIFRRRYIDGDTVAVISGELRVKPSAVYNRLSRGRRKLKRELSKE